MNRIQQLFGRKEKNILSVYFTAGYPAFDIMVLRTFAEVVMK